LHRLATLHRLAALHHFALHRVPSPRPHCMILGHVKVSR
jgi:hypothetical protein